MTATWVWQIDRQYTLGDISPEFGISHFKTFQYIFFNPTRQYRLDKRRSASIIKIFVSFDNWVKHTIRSRQKRNFHAGGNERTSINAEKTQTPRKIIADFSQGWKTQKNRWWKSTFEGSRFHPSTWNSSKITCTFLIGRILNRTSPFSTFYADFDFLWFFN